MIITSPTEVEQRLAHLRTTLLDGRGSGATEREIRQHTRDRPLLGAVPAPVERALTARQAREMRAGEPIAARCARARARQARRRAAFLGAATALATEWLLIRLIRGRRSDRR